jgi:hypothetical protein
VLRKDFPSQNNEREKREYGDWPSTLGLNKTYLPLFNEIRLHGFWAGRPKNEHSFSILPILIEPKIGGLKTTSLTQLRSPQRTSGMSRVYECTSEENAAERQ